MLTRSLDLFPPRTHPLILVSDPDGLLGGETILVELAGRDFRILKESDPVVLRCQVEAARPFTLENPLLVITPGSPEELPYDLWQPAHRVNLNLHQFFPHPAYPVLRALTPRQLERLADQRMAARTPTERLGRQATMDTLLRTVFDFDPKAAGQPHILIAWLVHLHDQLSPLPDPLAGRLLEHLQKHPIYQGWDLPALLESREYLAVFLQNEWQGFLRAPAENKIRESRLQFYEDEGLQNLLPALVRKGVLTPEATGRTVDLPDWAKAGVAAVDEDRRPERIAALLDELDQRASGLSTPTRWKDWQTIGCTGGNINPTRNIWPSFIPGWWLQSPQI